MQEAVEAASFAEKELEQILREIELQNERLVDVQRKAGMTHSHLIQNSRLIDDVFRVTRSRLAVCILVFFVVLWGVVLVVLKYW
jgi:type VI protein secretion system component VasF